MNPMRRALVRAAISASRIPSTKTSMLAASTKIVPRIASPVAMRSFSQTFRVADESTTDAFSQLQSDANGSTSTKPQADEHGYGLFVRNMVFEANEDHLREAFEKFGEITNVTVARDARGLSRGYGFVWFKTPEATEKAIDGTNASFWHGRRIQVSARTPRAVKRSIRGAGVPTRSLYVGNIPYETTDAELNRIFRELDNVTDVRVAVDRTTGWPRGFAHADFSDVESCTAGLQKLQGITIGGRELRLDYAAEVGNKAKD